MTTPTNTRTLTPADTQQLMRDALTWFIHSQSGAMLEAAHYADFGSLFPDIDQIGEALSPAAWARFIRQTLLESDWPESNWLVIAPRDMQARVRLQNAISACEHGQPLPDGIWQTRRAEWRRAQSYWSSRVTGSDNGAYQNTCAVLEQAIEIMALLDDTRLSYADFCLSFREHLEKFMVALGNVRWYQVSDSRVRSERAHAAFAVLFQALTADLAPVGI
jgi:hypothetical protein